MKNLVIFFIVCITSFLLSELSKYFLGINQLLYNSLAEELTFREVEELFHQQRRWQLWGYALSPLILYFKTHIIAFVLSMGAFLFDKKIIHKQLWRIVLKGELLFLLVGFIKIIWFSTFLESYTLQDVQYFYPLSMLSVIGYEDIEPWFIYPLQLINAFEIIYCVILALLIDSALKEQQQNLGIKIVACSYGPALLLWVGVIMFFTLSLN